MNKEINKIIPYFDYKIWGGHRIAKFFNISTTEKIGEAWLVSTHKNGCSKLPDGSFLSTKFHLPFLIKYIDTTDNLSVQVHPDDEFAQKHENDLGKSECWYILDSQKNAGIYLGFKEGVTQEIFKKAIDNKENANEYLNFFPVKRGDFFYVPAGMIHAIGAGVSLIEIQQSSGITYRVWDWNRLENNKPRELHVDKAFKVIDFNMKPLHLTEPTTFQFKNIHLKIEKIPSALYLAVVTKDQAVVEFDSLKFTVNEIR